jgi:hypothetical protein
MKNSLRELLDEPLTESRRVGSSTATTTAATPCPLSTLADVELISADYLAWYNQQRLTHRIGRVRSVQRPQQTLKVL